MQHTLYDMIWNEHLVNEQPDGICLLYVDRHIVHEVDSPQAFQRPRPSARGQTYSKASIGYRIVRGAVAQPR